MLHYLLWRFCLECTCLSPCSYALACGPNMAATLQALYTEYFLWHSDWLKLLRQLAAWNPVSSSWGTLLQLISQIKFLLNCNTWELLVFVIYQNVGCWYSNCLVGCLLCWWFISLLNEKQVWIWCLLNLCLSAVRYETTTQTWFMIPWPLSKMPSLTYRPKQRNWWV